MGWSFFSLFHHFPMMVVVVLRILYCRRREVNSVGLCENCCDGPWADRRRGVARLAIYHQSPVLRSPHFWENRESIPTSRSVGKANQHCLGHGFWEVGMVPGKYDKYFRVRPYGHQTPDVRSEFRPAWRSTRIWNELLHTLPRVRSVHPLGVSSSYRSEPNTCTSTIIPSF